MTYELRPLAEEHLEKMREILNKEIRESYVIYTEEEKTAEGLRDWLAHMKEEGYPMLGAFETGGDELLGFAYGDTYRKLSSYRTTAEVSLYVDSERRGEGLGKFLLRGLIEASRDSGLHALAAVIDSENETSLRLHESLGFERRGSWPEIARKFSSWREAVFLELLL